MIEESSENFQEEIILKNSSQCIREVANQKQSCRHSEGESDENTL